MGKPVIRGVSVSPDPLVIAPGGQAVFVVDAFDPGQVAVNITVRVTNQAGEVTEQALPPGQVGGIATYELEIRDNTGALYGVTEQDPAQPNRFIWTSPGPV